MTPVELVEILRRHDRFVKGKPGGARADLRGADLSGLRLPEINLHGASLAGSSFRKSEVKEADFSTADLYGANFEHADATAANFERADLSGARVQFVKMETVEILDAANKPTGRSARTILKGARLDGTEFSGTNTSEAVVDD